MKPLEGTTKKKTAITVYAPRLDDQKTIVVLGVERGGTSMVAGMIRALGIDMGERAGRNHEDPKFLTDNRDQLFERIKEYNNSKETWGFKVPKASLMLDFYDKHLRNPHYVLVFRNLEATVDSWCSRASSDPMGSALHAMKYYDAALSYLNGKKRPLSFVSYERACDNPEDFARELSDFLGTDSSEEDIQKATSIVTGEGGGYLDLPEYYFHIEALDFDARPSKALGCQVTEDSEKHLAFRSKKVGDRVVIHPEGEYFPKELFIVFDLACSDTSILVEQGLRVYMDFTGDFFPGHAFRPPLNKGKNLLKVSNNGNVRRIALGSLRPGYTFGFEEVSCFDAEEKQSTDAHRIIPPRNAAPTPILKRVSRKLRSLIAGR